MKLIFFFEDPTLTVIFPLDNPGLTRIVTFFEELEPSTTFLKVTFFGTLTSLLEAEIFAVAFAVLTLICKVFIEHLIY